MSAKILVTGGAGYIGSHTVVELINEGFEIVIADNFSNSNPAVLDRIKEITGVKPVFEELDVCNIVKLEEFFAKHQNIEAVIHFAAFKAVGESVADPLMYYQNNLVSLLSLLQCMNFNKVNKLVFSSSCTVYGQPEELPVTENSPLQKAASPYGNTKQISEAIIEDATRAYNLNCISLRYFNPIGAHDSALIGELPNGVPNNLVPFITQTAIGKRECLNVFGDNYNTPDGTCVRDYIHVVDLAKAHVKALQRLLKEENKKNEIYNVGTGNGYTVLQVIKAFEKASGEKLNYKIVDRRKGDVEKVYADTSLANKELGWKAEKSLYEMVSSAWTWEQELKKRNE